MGERHLLSPIRQCHFRLGVDTTTSEYFYSRRSLALHLREHSIAESSFKLYSRSFNRWKEWTQRRGIPWQLDIPLQAQLDIISEFIIDGTQAMHSGSRPVRSSTMKTTLCGIRHFFTAAGLLKGVSRRDAPPRRKSPVSVALLERCASELNLHAPADQALWGGPVSGLLPSASAVRDRRYYKHFVPLVRSESERCHDHRPGWHAHDRPGHSRSCLHPTQRLQDKPGWSADNKDAGTLRTPHSVSGTGRIAAPPSKERAPGRNSRRRVHGRRRLPRLRIGSSRREALQRAARAVGEDPSKFSTHSLRAGGATNMYRAGVDALTIQFHGRWASDTFNLYTRLCQESVASVAARMTSGSGEMTTLT